MRREGTTLLRQRAPRSCTGASQSDEAAPVQVEAIAARPEQSPELAGHHVDAAGPPKDVVADLLGVGGAHRAEVEVQRHALQKGVDPQLLGLSGGDATPQALPKASGLCGLLSFPRAAPRRDRGPSRRPPLSQASVPAWPPPHPGVAFERGRRNACAGAAGRSVVGRGGAGRGPGARRRPRRRLGAPHGRGAPLSGPELEEQCLLRGGRWW